MKLSNHLLPLSSLTSSIVIKVQIIRESFLEKKASSFPSFELYDYELLLNYVGWPNSSLQHSLARTNDSRSFGRPVIAKFPDHK